jgi:predicted transport protein
VEWFRYFWDGFPTYVRDNHIEWDKDSSDKEWSDTMFDFLMKLSQAMNYHAKKEEPTIRAKRFDMTWRSSDSPPKTIFIEHENQLIDTAVKDEIPKLADYRADLHVCITYVRERDFPGDEFAERTRKILADVGYDDEFLLILGSDQLRSPTDWVCFRFWQHPQIDSEKLVLPSPILLFPGTSEAAVKKGEGKAGIDLSHNAGRELNVYSEDDHLREVPAEIAGLYRKIRELVLGIGPDVSVRPRKFYIGFIAATNFVDFQLQKSKIGLWLNVKAGTLNDPRGLARDVSNVGHWGNGDYQVNVKPNDNLDYVMMLVRQSYLRHMKSSARPTAQ